MSVNAPLYSTIGSLHHHHLDRLDASLDRLDASLDQRLERKQILCEKRAAGMNFPQTFFYDKLEPVPGKQILISV